jgi:hypothetical protein
MIRRAAAVGGILLAAAVLGGGGGAIAQPASRQQVADELARLLMDSAARRAIDEQVRASLMGGLSATLQERLNRRLLDVEVDMLARIVRRFIIEALPPSRTEEIAARIYTQYFDEAELRELLAFQRSAVARKVARLAPELAVATADAIDGELRASPALEDALEELRRIFPVLGPPESP